MSKHLLWIKAALNPGEPSEKTHRDKCAKKSWKKKPKIPTWNLILYSRIFWQASYVIG